MMTGSVFIVLLIACRWFFASGGQLLQLSLMAASVYVTLGLVTQQAESIQSAPARRMRYAWAALTILALAVWSPGFAFALMVAAPVAAAAVLPNVLKRHGLQLGLLSIQPADDCANPLDELAASASSLAEKNEIESSDLVERELSSDVTDSEDLWLAVQQQFQQDPTLIQNLTRWQTADGTDCLVANLRCQSVAGQLIQTVHIPFWPIFSQTPQLHCRVVEGAEGNPRCTELKRHGARIEIRFNEKPPADLELVVEVLVTLEPAAEIEIAA